MHNRRTSRWIFLAIFIGAFVLLIANMSWWENALRFLFPSESHVIHPRASLLVLVMEHLELVLISSSITILVGIPLGVWVTRPSGKNFLPIVTDITFALGFIGGIAGIGPENVSFLAIIYSLAVLIPGLAVSVRRLHDTNRSGWWLLISLVPLIGTVVLLVFTVQDGQPGENQYGPNPKASRG